MKSKRPRRRHAVLGLAIMTMLSCGDSGGGRSDAFEKGEAGHREGGMTSTTAVPTTTTSPPTTAPPSTIPVTSIGQAATSGDWALLVHGVTDPYGPSTNASGYRVILVDVEVTYSGQGATTSLSTYNNFLLTAGGELRSPGGTDVQGMPSIGGPLAAGESRRAMVAFQVRTEITTGLQLTFRPGLVDDPIVAVQIS